MTHAHPHTTTHRPLCKRTGRAFDSSCPGCLARHTGMTAHQAWNERRLLLNTQVLEAIRDRAATHPQTSPSTHAQQAWQHIAEALERQ